ncbi:MAG: hypothetical protein UE295_02100 [Acutalibacteraceae bacterium]|nr:hypothetical protein [Acutalibacteraceae bacterium]
MIKKIICAFLLTTTMLSLTACVANGSDVVEKITQKIEESGDSLKSMEAEENQEDIIYAEDMVGKTFKEVLDSGYTYIGFTSTGDECSFWVTSDSVNDENTNIAQMLEGKTVKDLIDKGLSVDYFGLNGPYTFSTKIGDMSFKYDVDGAIEIVSKLKQEDPFVDIEEITEIHDMKLSNVEIRETRYTIKFDESFDASQYRDGNMIAIGNPREELKDCVIKEMYYSTVSEKLFN